MTDTQPTLDGAPTLPDFTDGRAIVEAKGDVLADALADVLAYLDGRGEVVADAPSPTEAR